jgi:lipopolysaccharide/colanic/teichoic acid biosynthesis glycosyltransferase
MSNEDLFTMDIYQSDNVIVSNSKNQKIIKKILDIVVSLVLLIVTSPILLISCIAIRLESEGTAIYKQVRYGFLGKEFTAYKLRTMYNHSSDGNLSAPQKGDKRVTHVGKFLRKTSIDELPQLLNVLKGDMSIIGPRAVPAKEIELRIEAMMENDASKKEVYQRAMEIRSLIKPGISGMAQANGRSDLSVEQATAYDVYYVMNYSLSLDIKIIIRTVQTILLRKGVN